MVNQQIIQLADDRSTQPSHPSCPSPLVQLPQLSHLSLEDLASLRENLREQSLFRREQLQQLSPSALTRTDALLDRQSPSRIEVRVKLAASARMVLADVEAALVRMDRGDYGACHLCRHPIDRERLLIVPQARYCARCARCQQARGADR
ncbi:TraR/DksA C4-type zinc finger protein [Streptomyces sp. NPDC032198]|uniref:TraR/DksA family transcriptional regulator n=1 Tax=Streptomyces sp. NPDC032198 TaxID=3155127 RepID=UPI0033E993D4